MEIIDNYRAKRQQRKEVKRNNPKRKKVWKVLGGIAIVLGAIILAIVLTARDNKDTFNSIKENIDFYLNALKRPVDEQILAPDQNSDTDKTSFINKCNAVGIVFNNGEINVPKGKIDGQLVFSANEFSAYLNSTIDEPVKIISSTISIEDNVYVLRSVLKFDLSSYVEDEQFTGTNAVYLTSKANLFCVGKRVVVKNIKNTINQFNEQDNSKMIGFMSDLGVDIEQISPAKMFVDELSSFVDKISVTITINADNFMFRLN